MERWLPIAGYEGMYEVSDAGRVRSLARSAKVGRATATRSVAPRLMRLALRSRKESNKGYLSVTLCKDGRDRTFAVHRLVAEAFISPRPHDSLHVCHENGDKLDNRAANLRYDTAAANAFDKVKHAAWRPYADLGVALESLGVDLPYSFD